jgi:hypothetical protein
MFGSNTKTMLRRALFAAFLMLEIYIGWKNYREIAATRYSASDTILQWEARLAPLKKVMPPSARVVGYASDAGEIGLGYFALDAQIEYTLTQFAMAPIVVAADPNHEWVIGNFTKPGFENWQRDNPGQTATPLSSGIYLIHRLDK